MTMLRSRLASGKALARIGQDIQLGDWLQMGKGELKSGGHKRPSNVADALEAVLGAAYLDGGLSAVTRIFKKLFLALLAGVDSADEFEDNPKGRLQEIIQRRRRANPHYHVVHQSGPAHKRVFYVSVTVGETTLGNGHGLTKRDAEQNAAQDAINNLPDKKTA